MATSFDRPHVQQESSLHMFKNTSRLQCVIPNSPPEASLSPASSSINIMDLRNSTSEPAAPPSSPTDPNADHITSLERSLCSDFVCCGAHLPDLHALLEHFEEDHIMVLAPNGKRVYPPEGLQAVPLHPLPTSLHSTPSSSRSSSVLSSPNSTSCPLSPSPSGPSSPSDLSSCLQGSFERRKSNVVAPIYTPFTPSLPIDPAYPYPDTTEIDMPLYDFSQDFYPTYSVQLAGSHFNDDDDDEEMSDAGIAAHPTSAIPTYVYGLDKSQPIAQIPKTVRGDGAAALRVSISKTSKAKNRQINSSNNSNSRRREKAYRCPTPRCTKSYLNPNGLKYHLEKGTCKIETDYESEGGEESNHLPPSAPITTTANLSSPRLLNRPEIQPLSLGEAGSYGRQQDESGSHPPLPPRQQYQYQYQYPHQQYLSSARPGQLATPIAVSSHEQ